MTTSQTLVLFSILIFFVIFLFRLSSFCLKKKYGFRLVFILYISILFCISFFFYFLRRDLVSWLGLCLSGILSTCLIWNVSDGEIIPYSSPANSSSEDSFGLQVLAEPWPVTHNIALESSMRNRILTMENAN